MAGQRGDPLVLVVQAGDVVELLAAGREERVARLDVDLFQRLQAVGGEAGADHVDPPHALRGERAQRRLGVGLQPLGLAEAALEA